MHSDLVTKAAQLAATAHQGQFRRDGSTPYVEHPRAVASRVSGDPVAEAVAWLHDVMEDTDATEETLRLHGMTEEVILSVRLLTKSGDIGYEAYLERIKSNPVARKVKIADMLSNLADQPSDRQIVKYCKGLLHLLS